MPRNFAQKTYEVFIADGSRWLFDAEFDVRSEAETYAAALIGEAKVPGVRVIAESHRTGNEEVILEERIDLADKPLQIVPVEEAAPCAELGDFYGFPARRTAGRLLRAFLDYHNKTALELMFDVGLLRALERNEKLFTTAVQRIATVQARDTGEKPALRSEALYAAFEQIKEHAADEKAAGGMLVAQGLDAVIAAAPKTAPDRDIHILAALAEGLAARGDWSDKLSMVLALIGDCAPDARAAYLDGVAAEIVDGHEAITQLFGGFGDVISACRALVHLSQGRCQVVNDRSCLADFNRVMAVQPLPMTAEVLLCRVAAAMGGVRPLTREGGATETDAYKGFVRDAVELTGLVGGPEMAGAVVKRGQMLLGGDEDLSYAEATERLTDLLPNRAVRLGFLLDVLATPEARACEREVLATLARLVRQLTSLSSLVPVDAGRAETDAIIAGLTAKMTSDALPEQMRTLFSETLAQLQSEAPAGPEASPAAAQETITEYTQAGIQRRQAKAGEILFNEGDAADVGYLVLEGTVEIFRTVGGKEKSLAFLGRGEVLGEMSLIDNQPRMASARVYKDTKLSVITQKDLQDRLDKLSGDDMVLRRLIDVLVTRLRGQGRMHE